MHGSFPDARESDMDAAFWWAGGTLSVGQRVFRRIVFLGTITYPKSAACPTLRDLAEPDRT